MTIEILNTGSELLLGRVLNTHQQWLCRRLADAGYVVVRQTAVPDTATDIEIAVREALARADLVLTTGGLGPTSDDLTRDRLAGVLGLRLVEDPAARANIDRFFQARGRPTPPSTLVQAQVPEDAVVLQNANGTAPGLALRVPAGKFRERGSWLILLPGPPRELRPMFLDQVLPLVRRELPLDTPFACRTLKTTGLGESIVEERLAPLLVGLVREGLEIGYCARTGEVDLRFSAHGPVADSLVAAAEGIARTELGRHLYGEEDETLETVVVRLLTAQGKTLALAESCTGGHVADRLTNVPGASAVLIASLVTYHNDAKCRFLGVPAGLLASHGAVSEPVARAMAEGARRETGATFALGITGIAGPGGGTPSKPVGTAFIALAGPRATRVLNPSNPFDRETFKFVTSQQALEFLRRDLVQTAGSTDPAA